MSFSKSALRNQPMIIGVVVGYAHGRSKMETFQEHAAALPSQQAMWTCNDIQSALPCPLARGPKQRGADFTVIDTVEIAEKRLVGVVIAVVVAVLERGDAADDLAVMFGEKERGYGMLVEGMPALVQYPIAGR